MGGGNRLPYRDTSIYHEELSLNYPSSEWLFEEFVSSFGKCDLQHLWRNDLY